MSVKVKHILSGFAEKYRSAGSIAPSNRRAASGVLHRVVVVRSRQLHAERSQRTYQPCVSWRDPADRVRKPSTENTWPAIIQLGSNELANADKSVRGRSRITQDFPVGL